MPTKKYIPGKYYTGEPCKNGHIAERWNYNGMCVICKREVDKVSNKTAGKRYRIRKLYGLSEHQVQQMMDAQQNQCAICSEVFNTSHEVMIDHCHTTNVVRGLLCISCNWVLGHSKDNPTLLTKAANYLIERKKDGI